MTQTLLDKIWDAHVVTAKQGYPSILYIDLQLVHEVTSPQAFDGLKRRNLSVRRPKQTLATMDHSTPTESQTAASVADWYALGKPRPGLTTIDRQAAHQLDTLVANCHRHNIELHRLGTDGNGIVHVMGPEQGRTLPGMTVVCGDSHTSTHGAFGAFALGIGTSEVEMVLATQCLLLNKPRSIEVRFEGMPRPGVTAKDFALALISQVGTDAGTGAAFEYTGDAINALDMDGRMTLCNMSIEAGARAGLIAPDETTFQYLAKTPCAPKGRAWERAIERWRTLKTDASSAHDEVIVVDALSIAPMVTYGNTPAMAVPVNGHVPPRDRQPNSRLNKSLEYMNLQPGQPIAGQPISTVFIGSCTNSRLSDLRSAAKVLRGRKVAPGVRMLVVPGSERIKVAAENEGLSQVFIDAGAEWRSPGCSMCIAMNDDRLRPGEYAVSTSNRNFEGRQGPASRTFLASPITAAASAIAGCVADPRSYMESTQ
ncbi:MAG: 3-isopropylmalate dehydratase large subunit [Myxococcota bacterium]